MWSFTCWYLLSAELSSLEHCCISTTPMSRPMVTSSVCQNVQSFKILFRCYYYVWIILSLLLLLRRQTDNSDTASSANAGNSEDGPLPKALSLKEQMEQVMKDSGFDELWRSRSPNKRGKNDDKCTQGGDTAVCQNWQPRSLSAEGIQLFVSCDHITENVVSKRLWVTNLQSPFG